MKDTIEYLRYAHFFHISSEIFKLSFEINLKQASFRTVFFNYQEGTCSLLVRIKINLLSYRKVF